MKTWRNKGYTPSQFYQDLVLTAAVVMITFAVVASSQSTHPQKSKFRDPEVVRNKEHVQEHLEELTGSQKREEDMTSEELEFHYFKLHDFDNNTKLDGLEILAAISHAMSIPMDSLNGRTVEEVREQRLKSYAEMIDQVLEEDDFNNDGYLTYLEYVLARRRAESEMDHKEKK